PVLSAEDIDAVIDRLDVSARDEHPLRAKFEQFARGLAHFLHRLRRSAVEQYSGLSGIRCNHPRQWKQRRAQHGDSVGVDERDARTGSQHWVDDDILIAMLTQNGRNLPSDGVRS